MNGNNTLWTIALLSMVNGCSNRQIIQSTPSLDTIKIQRGDQSLETQVYRLEKELAENDDGDSYGYPLPNNPVGVRVFGIDTPEITHIEHGILQDQLGIGIYVGRNFSREASELTNKLRTEAIDEIIFKVRDGHYGRALSYVLLQNNEGKYELLQEKLIRANLAYYSSIGERDNLIIYIGDQIIDCKQRIKLAWDEEKTETRQRFQNPRLWRRNHQQRKTHSIPEYKQFEFKKPLNQRNYRTQHRI